MRTIQQYLDETKRKQYINKNVLNIFQVPKEIKKDLVFFKIGRSISCSDLEKEFASRNLDPVDLFSLCVYDIENPQNMDEMKYVGTQWKDDKGNFCYADFGIWEDGRGVGVDCIADGWNIYWWFAGVSKFRRLETKPSRTLELDSAIELVKKSGYKIFKEV